jgi:queuine tRNA-ribosyltransferase subunit QTRTD1
VKIIGERSLDSPNATVVATAGGLHKLVSLTGFGMVAVARDSLMDESNGENASKMGASFETSAGRRLVCTLPLHHRLYELL